MFGCSEFMACQINCQIWPPCSEIHCGFTVVHSFPNIMTTQILIHWRGKKNNSPKIHHELEIYQNFKVFKMELLSGMKNSKLKARAFNKAYSSAIWSSAVILFFFLQNFDIPFKH
ncbi:hypothetical protein CEXT_336701 [Caerostris extrusa]|uniref:Uncharacterized protein n=1 Tax=Caerostris extrusa TaxID=172846 RepID=A0AAV4N3I1_CAEEX|nr:hypothetical protein CEXT_336701 [Caerostris extrusa]